MILKKNVPGPASWTPVESHCLAFVLWGGVSVRVVTVQGSGFSLVFTFIVGGSGVAGLGIIAGGSTLIYVGLYGLGPRIWSLGFSVSSSGLGGGG